MADMPTFYPTTTTSMPTISPSTTTSSPTASPSTATSSPTASPSTTTSSPTANPTTTLSPTATATSTPAGATYYTGFEKSDWPQSYPGWSTSTDDNADLVWTISTERVNSGTQAIKSPVLDTEAKTPATSTLTFIDDINNGPGSYHYSLLASVEMPYDLFEVYVDGELSFQITNQPMTEFEDKFAPVTPQPGGGHTIEFVYKFNPSNLAPGSFPPNFPGRTGEVIVDDVYFLPLA